MDADNNVTEFLSINPEPDLPAKNDQKLASLEHREKPKMAETWRDMFIAWPKITFCILINEACERFSYYGMRTVLTLYLLNVLKYNENDSSIFFNVSSSICYLFSLLGAIIADGFLGKFLTILFVSILYAIGQIILAFVSTRSNGSSLHPFIDFLGLFLIAMGTGGIKPCVSPFGGDQFDQYQTRMISIFFAVFYFSVNTGSMISTFITPMFRATPCLGQDTCYPLAFGIPAILMIIATVIFTIGSPWYKKKPPKTNIFKDVMIIIKRALSNKFRTEEKREHWLDHALTTHICDLSPACKRLKRKQHDSSACAEAKLIEDVKSLFRVLVMYLPLPIFWSLYDQQASTWTIQAIQMDSRLWGTTLMFPDQMQVLNAILILLFIPIFQVVVYPVWSIFFKVTPLRKMVVGGYLAGFAFLIAALVQLLVNKTLPILPSDDNVYVSVFNTIENCDISATAVSYKPINVRIPAGQALQNYHKNVTMFEVKPGDVIFQFTYTGSNCPTLEKQKVFSIKKDSQDEAVQYIHISSRGMFLAPIKTKKPTEGTGEHATAIVADLDSNYDENFAFCRHDDGSTTCNVKKKQNYYFFKQKYTNDDGNQTDIQNKYYYGNNAIAVAFKVKSVRAGNWRLYYRKNNTDDFTWTGYEYSRNSQGSVYLLSLTGSKGKPRVTEMMVTQDNAVSILWQIPQIVTITAAEILFSITGLEFSYTQAAPSMKSIVGACFLLTVGIGDMLIVVINLIHYTDNYAYLFFSYTVLMTFVITIFALMCIFYYKYADFTDVSDDDEIETLDESHNDSSSTKAFDK